MGIRAGASGSLPQKIKTALAGVRAHWSAPAAGYYVPHKEIGGLSLGKFGFSMALSLAMQIGLHGSNVIISQALHVDPVHITAMGTAVSILNFWFTLVRSHWVDNSHSREGRFRPFMKVYGIPTLALASAVVWFPFHRLPNGGEAVSGQAWGTGYWMKVGILLVILLGLEFFKPLYALGFENIIKVMSPNSQERLNIQIVTTVVGSAASSIYDTCFYMLSGKFANSLADIRLYRYAYIPVSVVGLAVGYFAYFSTRERVVQSRAHYSRVGLWDSFRAVAKNKNFWILSASSWAGFLEGNSNDLLRWTFIYQKKISEVQYTAADMAVRCAALLSFAAVPPAAKRFGKRFLLIGCNLVNIVLLAASYKTFRFVPALVIFRFVNYFFNVILENIQPALDADIRDAQQYLTGERIDGMFGMVGYVGSFIGMGTGFITPYIWRRSGIHEGNGAVDFEGKKSMWFALRDQAVFDRVARSMIATSVIGAVMNVVPLFFYDLTEPKQRGMSKVLKLRALFEDYANGIVKPEALRECAEIIRQARADEGDPAENQYVLTELNKYDAPEMRPRLALAREICKAGYEGILRFDPARCRDARRILRKTRRDKAMMKAEVEVLREMKEAQRHMARFYPDSNPVEPDLRELDALYDAQPRSRREARDLQAQIKVIEAERSVFYHSTRPYTRARQLLADRENAARVDEIFEGVAP